MTSHRWILLVASVSVALAGAPAFAAPLAGAGPLGAVVRDATGGQDVAYRHYRHRGYLPGAIFAGAAFGLLGLAASGAYGGYGDEGYYGDYGYGGGYGYGGYGYGGGGYGGGGWRGGHRGGGGFSHGGGGGFSHGGGGARFAHGGGRGGGGVAHVR